MKRFRFHLAVLFVVVAALLSVVLFEAANTRGQSQNPRVGNRETTAKPTSLVRERGAHNLAAFSPAVARNNELRTSLDWIFGGKPQRGWYLYAPLIGRLLKTGDDSNESFAAALANWQQKSGLTPTGVLEQDTLYALVAHWQGQRLKNRSPAVPEQLITAPVSDFYDPERLPELRQVERETYAAYKRMIAAAAADHSLRLALGKNGELAPGEKYMKIISAFRTRAYQDQLRKQQPNAGSAGLAVNSPHFTGRALDLYVGGEPVESADANRAIQIKTPAYQWLVRNADRFGFRPYYYEPWHWEYVGR